MSAAIEICAEADKPWVDASFGFPKRRRRGEEQAAENLPAHRFRQQRPEEAAQNVAEPTAEEAWAIQRWEQEERERRIYRAWTVAMLRRYMRYSIETGRMPSLLGGEFFRAKVTAYTVVTFEDRVIFVHDMETCLGRLDEFAQQLLARHILQEHDRRATAKLLGCNERTVRRCTPLVLDQMSEILIEAGLMKRLGRIPSICCQEGKTGPFDASDSDDEE
jgi:hypothetical protein